MRGYVPEYELIAAKTLDQALALVGEEWRPFAGGTDLMVLLEAGKLQHRKFVSIWGLAELKGVDVTPEAVTIGALTTYTDVLRHPLLRAEFPMLAQAAAETGGIATQNRGTLGGNIANASPAADSPPALLVYDAELELVSVRGERRVRYRTFHTGYKQTVLAADELILNISLPHRFSGYFSHASKCGARNAQAISKVYLAALGQVANGAIRDVRLALGSVAPVPLRLNETEKMLTGKEIAPSLIDAARKSVLK